MKKLLLLLLISFSAFSQTFTNNIVSAQNSWNGSLSKTISVNGLPNLSSGVFELAQVNIHLGSQSDGTFNSSSYKVTLTSPTGTIFTLINNGNLNNTSVREYNLKLRDNPNLKYPSSHTSYQPFDVGYYKSFGAFSTFNSLDPNGNWTVTITEGSTVSSGAKFNKVDLVFKTPFTVQDYTTNTTYDNCASPFCLGIAQIIIASNNGFTSQPSDMFDSNTSGCPWNGAINNSAWFKFIAQNTNAKITISGISNNLQILGIRSSATNPCVSSSNSVLAGGCPDDLINDTYTSSQYVNGSTGNNQLNLSGLTIGQTYYFIVDGNSGSISPFYIEIEGASVNCSNCMLNAIASSNSPVCSGSNLNLFVDAGVSWLWSGPNGFTSTLKNPIISNASNLMNGIYTVLVTDSLGCTDTKNINVVVNDAITPSFTLISQFCSGTTPPSLPLTSSNGISGTWSPSAINNITSGIYTFTPTAGQCATTTTMNIQVLSTCTFNTFASAVWLDNCATANFFNTTGSGTDLIGLAGNVFPNTNLGVYTQNSGTLKFRGAEVKTFKTATSNVCGVNLNYRIYLQGSTAGSFTVLPLTFFDNCVSGTFASGGPCNIGDQKWQTVSSTSPYPIDLTLFPPGNYKIEVYYDVSGSNTSTTGCSDLIYLNNGGTNYISTFTIQQTPQFVGSNPTICNASDGSITISGLASNVSYAVSYNDDGTPIAPISLTSSATGEIIISGLNAGSYTNLLLGYNSCSYTNPAAIVLVNPIILTPNLTTTAATCSADGTTTMLNYVATNTYTFLPTGPSVGAGGSISGAALGTSYTVTSGNGSCTSNESVPFTNAAQLITPAIPTFTLSPATCSADGTTTMLNYVATNTYTFLPTGPSVGAGGSISGAALGTSYTVTSGNGSCTSNESVAFVNAAQLITPAVPTFTTTAATCLANGTTTIFNYGATNTYTFSPAGPSVGAGGSITGATLGTSYTVTSGNASCTSNASVPFTNVAQLITPDVPTFTTTAATCLANGTTTISNYVATNTYTFSPADILSVGAGGIINGATLGTSYTVTSGNASCTSNESVAFTNATQLITPAVPTFTQVAPICSGGSFSLPSTSDNGIVGTWSPAIDTTNTTLYTFTPTTGQCPTTASMTVTVNDLPNFTISNGCDGVNYVLSAVVTNGASPTYIWYDALHQPIGTSSSITITDAGNYSVAVLINGCSEEKPITVADVFCSIPKGISPNGDGDNDFFDLTNLNVQNLQIFNRYGMEVYSKSDYKKEWNGKTNGGKELPDGTYYYIVNFATGKTKTGWVYINK
jgi:gliding motility-associated-like protein